MKFIEDFFDLSEEAYKMLGLNVAKNDDEILKKQDKVLRVLFNKFKEQLVSESKKNNGILKVKFKSIFYSDFNDGYREIDELVKSNNFDSFASEYCIYLGDIESRCDEERNAYYEIIWDYKTYFEQLKIKQADKFKKAETAILPYPVGTYLTTEENGKTHIDQILQYVFSNDGLSVFLILDVFEDPRRSRIISIDNLLNNWNEYNLSHNTSKKKK